MLFRSDVRHADRLAAPAKLGLPNTKREPPDVDFAQSRYDSLSSLTDKADAPPCPGAAGPTSRKVRPGVLRASAALGQGVLQALHCENDIEPRVLHFA